MSSSANASRDISHGTSSEIVPPRTGTQNDGGGAEFDSIHSGEPGELEAVAYLIKKKPYYMMLVYSLVIVSTGIPFLSFDAFRRFQMLDREGLEDNPVPFAETLDSAMSFALCLSFLLSCFADLVPATIGVSRSATVGVGTFFSGWLVMRSSTKAFAAYWGSISVVTGFLLIFHSILRTAAFFGPKLAAVAIVTFVMATELSGIVPVILVKIWDHMKTVYRIELVAVLSFVYVVVAGSSLLVICTLLMPASAESSAALLAAVALDDEEQAGESSANLFRGYDTKGYPPQEEPPSGSSEASEEAVWSHCPTKSPTASRSGSTPIIRSERTGAGGGRGGARE
eukprot:GHVU01005702.1.p1 GENE.GHVU01005702.1~~GHVU01005702.1.p1  ORF type:complete len:340 (+),score=31.93 GHVU01005702.1:1214-2233(+)